MKQQKIWAFIVSLLVIIFFVWGEVLDEASLVMADDELQVQASPEVGESYDLVVYGGEPEGVAAALAGARAGLKTLLVMEEDGPGGLIVYGALNFLDLNYDDKGHNIHKGIFQEWHRMAGGDVIVDVGDAKLAFMRLLLAEENLTIVPVTHLQGFQLSDNQREITDLVFETTGVSKTHDATLKQKVLYEIHPDWWSAAYGMQSRAKLLQLEPGTLWRVQAKRYIDATPDADLAAEVGVPYFLGGADIGLPERKMAVTLVFRVKNVDWKGMGHDIRTEKWGTSRMNATAAWGLGKIGQQYKPVDSATRLRGLNVARQKDGTVFINALLIFNLDVLHSKSLEQGMEQGKAEAVHIVQYLQRELAGFQNAELMDFSPQLYVRESRHILALYQLSILDLVEKVDFPDKIALGSYPVDVQASHPDTAGYVVLTPGLYSIPFRSLVPLDKVNLLVVSRSAGYSSLAAGSTRVIPVGMAVAEAAGHAAALSIEHGLSFHELAYDDQQIAQLQERLKAWGVNLQKVEGSLKITKDPDYPILKVLFDWGMLSAGYDNDLRLEQTVTEREFAFMLSKGLRQRKASIYSEYLAGGLYSLSKDQPLYPAKASEIALAAGGFSVSKIEDPYYTAILEGFIPSDLVEKWNSEQRPLTRREMYRLAVPLFQRYPMDETIVSYRTRPLGQ